MLWADSSADHVAEASDVGSWSRAGGPYDSSYDYTCYGDGSRSLALARCCQAMSFCCADMRDTAMPTCFQTPVID